MTKNEFKIEVFKAIMADIRAAISASDDPTRVSVSQYHDSFWFYGMEEAQKITDQYFEQP